MAGFYARADSKQPIRTDLDNELAGMQTLIVRVASTILILRFRRSLVHS